MYPDSTSIRRVRRGLAAAVLLGGVLISASPVARAETFDLATFEPPPGTRSETAHAVGYTVSAPTTFAVYAVYRSVPGTGDPARDFQDEWQAIVTRVSRQTTELRTQTVDWPGGWKMTMGAAKVWTPEQRNYGALMSVFTGYGVKLSVLVKYNDDLYRPDIDRFLAAIRLAKPAASPSAPAGPATGAAPGALTAHEWYRSVASTWQSDGYLRYRYRFGADGTYSFMKEWWSQYHHLDYWFIEESGRYRIEGGTVQLSPEKAAKLLRDKAGNARGAPEPVALEPARYRFQFQQLYKETLILSPVTGQTTVRDGKQFSFAGDGKSYYFEPPSRCEQRPAPADC